MPLTRDSGVWMLKDAQELGSLKKNLWSRVGNRLQEPPDVYIQPALNAVHLHLLEFGNILHSVPPKMGKHCCAKRVLLVKNPSSEFSTATQEVMMPLQWQNTFLTKGQKQLCFNKYRIQFHWPAVTCLIPVQGISLNIK